MSDLEDAKELLITITKRAQTTVSDSSVHKALQILLRDYIERASESKRDAEKLGGRA